MDAVSRPREKILSLAQIEPSKSAPQSVPFTPTHVHKKSGVMYQILDVVIDATNSREGGKIVLYRNSLGVKFARDSGEFFDGRFEGIIL
jgi:hypothetical protein